MSVMTGIHVASCLKNDARLKDLVGSRIFPLNVPEGVSEWPFIVYETSVSSADDTKDELSEMSNAISVNVVSNDYFEMQMISQYVINALDRTSGEYPNESDDELSFEVTECRFKSYEEDFELGSFIGILSFDCITNQL